jgi:hypothetical protein
VELAAAGALLQSSQLTSLHSQIEQYSVEMPAQIDRCIAVLINVAAFRQHALLRGLNAVIAVLLLAVGVLTVPVAFSAGDSSLERRQRGPVAAFLLPLGVARAAIFFRK